MDVERTRGLLLRRAHDSLVVLVGDAVLDYRARRWRDRSFDGGKMYTASEQSTAVIKECAWKGKGANARQGRERSVGARG
jgi:hypothetical protein